eukprot:c8250_g1_i1.p1 GENE.c8250_g1_i1~~c8250_g1_i1.p1  ORF type:complete len:531 (-),score=88.84 c8250_g1_i1:766-2358(-)
MSGQEPGSAFGVDPSMYGLAQGEGFDSDKYKVPSLSLSFGNHFEALQNEESPHGSGGRRPHSASRDRFSPYPLASTSPRVSPRSVQSGESPHGSPLPSPEQKGHHRRTHSQPISHAALAEMTNAMRAEFQAVNSNSFQFPHYARSRAMSHEPQDDDDDDSSHTPDTSSTLSTQQLLMGGLNHLRHMHQGNTNNGKGSVMNGVIHNSSGVPLGNRPPAEGFDMSQPPSSHPRHRRSHSDSVKFLASGEGFRLIIPPATLDTLRNIDSDNQSVTVILAPEPSSSSLGPDGSPRFRADMGANNKSSTRPKHYKCSKCGQPKKGHVCEYASDKPPRAPKAGSPTLSSLLSSSQGVRSVGQRTGTSPRDLNSGPPSLHHMLHQPLHSGGGNPQDPINMARSYLQNQLSQTFPQDLNALMMGTGAGGMMGLDHDYGSNASGVSNSAAMMMASMAHNNNGNLPVFPQDPSSELNLAMFPNSEERDEAAELSIFEAMEALQNQIRPTNRPGSGSGFRGGDFTMFLSQDNMEDLDDHQY